MKIVALIPVCMTDNSREINLKNLNNLKNSEFKYVDEVVVCDQCFLQSDYIDGFTYIGPYGRLPYGLAQARNLLFNWFYNSDYDYALLLDARENLSKSGLNSFATVCTLIHEDKMNVDCIQSTLGVIVSDKRIVDKQRDDYKDNICIRYMSNPAKPGLHHMFISNYKKKYGFELYIDQEKVTTSGHITDSLVFEDIYFHELLKTYLHIYEVSDMTVNTGSSKASLWASNGGESLKGVNYQNQLKNMIIVNHSWLRNKVPPENYYFKRVDEYKDLLTDYKPRNKKDNDYQLDLFDF